jgi:MFS family permease
MRAASTGHPVERAMSTPGHWRHPAVLAAAGLAACAGFGQYAISVSLADVAQSFGEPEPPNGIAAQVGMTGTALGLGLAVIRLASLASLPIARLADRIGRRRILLWSAAGGLALTASSALAPAFWVFVALLALARPLLSATNGVAGVTAAEETSSRERAKAVALIGAAYAVGSGLPAVARGIFEGLDFRLIFGVAVVPLLFLPLLARWVAEPARYARLRSGSNDEPEQAVPVRPRLGVVPAALRPRLAVVCTLHLGVGLVTGPVNTYLFAYAERVLGLAAAVMSVLVVAAGALGLGGLLIGRWAADAAGRRITAGLSMAVASAAGWLTYSGAIWALVVGYLLSVTAASVFAPAAGSLDAEIFPTSMRATAVGWLTVSQVLGGVVGLAAFGWLADTFARFSAAAAIVCLPVVAVAVLYTRLPETRGRELEETAPEPLTAPGPANRPGTEEER